MLTPHYFELILYKAYADLRSEAEKTYIGFLWWILDPIIFMSIFYIVFGLLLKRGTEDFIPFLLIGLVVWRWFQNTVSHGANTILINRGLMRQVYLPKIIFPIVVILIDLAKFAFVFILLLIYLWIEGFPIGISYLALPILLIIQLILIIALTCFAAALVPFLPDLKILIDHALHILFFLSGIFFAGSSIPEQYQFYFYLNPMANIIEGYREILMYNQWPNGYALLVIGSLSLLGIVGSYRLLEHYDHVYPKIAI
jgi:lipopolysaccharide transport system permease protein